MNRDKKVMVVFGTRPEAIKMCPVVSALKDEPGLRHIVCLTGQHREMLRQVMDVFGIKEDINLDIMRDDQTLFSITRDSLKGLEQVLKEEAPDLVLVHGDTTTSFAAALSAFYREIPVGHVEAGLRTWNLKAPYPEEFNRQAVDMLSALHFAPTSLSRDNLLKEGRDSDHVFVTGNTVIDAMSVTVREDYTDENLEWALEGGRRMILLTAHRRENLGDPMRSIFRAVKRITKEFDDIRVVYPIHMNPRVRAVADEVFAGTDSVRLIEPLDVMAFHNYMSRSRIILTDSGGVQEEAPSLGVPVLVLRETTERPEGIEAGTLLLTGTDEDRIFNETKRLLTDEDAYAAMSNAVNPYGDGHASERIVRHIKEWFA